MARLSKSHDPPPNVEDPFEQAIKETLAKSSNSPFNASVESCKSLEAPAPSPIFACSFENCNKVYSKQRSLSSHKYRKHNIRKENVTALPLPPKTLRTLKRAKSKYKSVASGNRESVEKIIQPEFHESLKSYSNERQLTDHQLKKHEFPKPVSEIDKVFQCDLGGCSKSYDTARGVADHKLREHRALKESSSLVGAKVPTLAPKVKKSFKCEIEGCEKTYAKPGVLADHKWRTHHIPKILNTRTPTRFRKEKTTALEQAVKPFKCDVDGCDKGYDKTGVLDFHRLKVHQIPKPFVGKVVVERLVAERVVIVKKFQCEFEGCEKSYTHVRTLVNHKLKSHQPEKNADSGKEVSVVGREFRCSIEGCFRRYDKVTKLVDHKRKKHGIKPSTSKGEKAFKCLVLNCEKSFSELRTLISHHNKIHNEESRLLNLPFQCSAEKCSRAFRDEQRLKEHAGKRHAEIKKLSSKAKPEKSFECEDALCTKSYFNIDALHRHYNSKHKDILPKKAISCPVIICPKSYSNDEALKIHVDTKHKELLPRKQFVCLDKKCIGSFDTARGLRAHVRAKHKELEDLLPPIELKAKALKVKTTNAEKTFKCHILGCRENFASTNDKGLKSHQAKNHNIYRCKYNDCMVAGASKEEIGDHHIKIHKLKVATSQSPKEHNIAAGTYPAAFSEVAESAAYENLNYTRVTAATSHNQISIKTPDSAKRFAPEISQTERFKRVRKEQPSLPPQTPYISNGRLNQEIREEHERQARETPGFLPIQGKHITGRKLADSFHLEIRSMQDLLLPTPRRPLPRWSQSPKSSVSGLDTPNSPPKSHAHSNKRNVVRIAQTKQYNSDLSYFDTSTSPKDLSILDRFLLNAPKSSYTSKDLDALLQFPNEISGIKPRPNSTLKRHEKKLVKSQKKKVAVSMPVMENNVISLNCSQGKELYKPEYLENGIAGEAKGSGTIVTGSCVQDIFMDFTSDVNTREMSILKHTSAGVVAQAYKATVASAKAHTIKKPHKQSASASLSVSRKYTRHRSDPNKAKRPYHWRSGGKRAHQAGIMKSIQQRSPPPSMSSVTKKNKQSTSIAEHFGHGSSAYDSSTMLGDDASTGYTYGGQRTYNNAKAETKSRRGNENSRPARSMSCEETEADPLSRKRAHVNFAHNTEEKPLAKKQKVTALFPFLTSPGENTFRLEHISSLITDVQMDGADNDKNFTYV